MKRLMLLLALSLAIPALAGAQGFAVLGGTAVTCTASAVNGDIGVWPGTAITNTGCSVVGTLHPGDQAAQSAFVNFGLVYGTIRDNPPACRAHLTGTLSGVTLIPGVYCVDAVAKTGTLTLNAGGNEDATWLFLVNGALTGTNFTVNVINGGDPCNVSWWTVAAATLTDSNFSGNILAGAAATVTRGALHGNIMASAAVTLTNTVINGCDTVGGVPHVDCGMDDDHHDGHHGHHGGDDDHNHDGDDDHHDGHHCINDNKNHGHH